MNLREKIADEIHRRGPIPFSRFMELCLYDPEFGYYSRAEEKFGKAGDFYTSSDVHAVFGRLLARQFDEMWRAMDAPPSIEVIEIGPGRGLFAQDVLDWVAKKFWDFQDALVYRLVETSSSLRARLQDRFSDRIAEGKVSVHESLADLPPTAEHSIIFANELFDALPVEVVSDQGGLRIGYEAGRFAEIFVKPTEAELKYLDTFGVHPGEGERSEARPFDESYMRAIAGRLRTGFLVLIDYGYTQEELLAGRPKSTVRAFRKHTISNTPYEAPGEQDITANVNFTALRQIGQSAGLDFLALVTQSQFLMGIGEETQFADAFEASQMAQERAKVALQLKHLIMPEGMGDAFHVLVFSHAVERDKTTPLAGLKFARR